jgi:microcystin degradation protein MlrC
MKRVMLAQFSHESNGFSPVATDYDSFRNHHWSHGAEAFATWTGTNTEAGGMIEGAEAAGYELAPTILANALPAGTIARAAFDRIVRETCAAARAVGHVDGMLVVLHGAMQVDGIEDPEAEYLRALRSVVGAQIPCVATFDLHANIARGLFDAADILIGYDTFPHVDAGARGREAAEKLARLMSGERPRKALCKLPLITPTQRQLTAVEPMRHVMDALKAAERAEDIWCCSIAQGFAYADSDRIGVAVMTYGDAADAVAARIAGLIWAARDQFAPVLVPVEDAVARAVQAPRGPVVLAEPADNVGAGAPGDGTVILDALLRRKVRGSVVVMWDQAAAREAVSAGMGARFAGPVGGKASTLHGAPVTIDGVVRFAGDVSYARTGAFMTGQRVAMGRCAVVDCDGVQVVLTERRVTPFDRDHLTAVGIDPKAMRVIVAKSSGAWRAAFGDMCSEAILVDTPGVCAENLAHLPYRKRRKLYPLDSGAHWP